MGEAPKRESTGRHAFLVGAGILLSRIVGLVRQYVFSHYFGLRSDAADAFNQAFRIPNFLQTLFGEGVLSASFIPVYARLLAQGDEEEAGRVAGAVAAILASVTSVIVLAGVLATPLFVDVIAWGFHGAKRELTIHIVRILFPGAGLLVMSAWCLGILNSHRKFFLSYTAPVAWNVAMIATLVGFGGRVEESSLALTLAWGSVAGSALQFGVQLPVVLRLARGLRLRMATELPDVREIVRNFIPVFISRGVVQISAFVDGMLASPLPTGAVTGLQNAQTLYTLPVSLFGMAVSAAELPAMSSALGDEAQVAGYLRQRLNAGLRNIAFFIVPSAMAFLALGDVIAAGLFQSGKFEATDAVYVWGIVAGSAVGLLASTLGRLYSSTYYALRDTRTPLRFAVIRVALTTALGYVCAIPLPLWLGINPRWGVAGLTASAGVAGWVEFALLRRSLNRRIGATGLPAALLAKLWGSAAVAAGVAWAVKLAVGQHNPKLTAAAVLAPYGLVYFGITYLLRVEECAGALGRLARLRR
ncbi:Integral membrane protein MviN [Candidatus Sulfopaludibacter sp. SbA4]|nr:Integral membrane protein MviN [Candidatus Sulfopaludibacter sp. SbA4]